MTAAGPDDDDRGDVARDRRPRLRAGDGQRQTTRQNLQARASATCVTDPAPMEPSASYRDLELADTSTRGQPWLRFVTKRMESKLPDEQARTSNASPGEPRC